MRGKVKGAFAEATNPQEPQTWGLRLTEFPESGKSKGTEAWKSESHWLLSEPTKPFKVAGTVQKTLGMFLESLWL